MALRLCHPHPIFGAVVTVCKGEPVSIKHIWVMIKTTFSSWLDDYAPSMGAALAYYTLFSIAPLLLIVISTAGLVFGEDAVRGEIFAQLRDLMGDQGAQAVQSLLASVSEPKKGIAGTSSELFCWWLAQRACWVNCRTRSTASGAHPKKTGKGA